MVSTTPDTHLPAEFIPPPARVFLVGVAGIGMSGLAQLLLHQGYEVGGSDRELVGPGRDGLLGQLAGLGVRLWPQDGSGVRAMQPHAIVISSAVEKGNPDLDAGGDTPCIPRAQALAAALNRTSAKQIAVAGSCGKTTVTGWTASALRALGCRVQMVCGGMVAEFATATRPGNFFSDPDPEWAVYEVDESDGSLVVFNPDYGAVLNLGTDHHDTAKLLQLFGTFLSRCRSGIVVPADLARQFPPSGTVRASLFSGHPLPDTPPDVLFPEGYQPGPQGIRFRVGAMGEVSTSQFGAHSASNACAVFALLRLLGLASPPRQWPAALRAFRGVSRRFELAGVTARGTPVYDDYAHNVEKIGAALSTARETCRGRVLAVFQPHGFGPLGFMRAPMKSALREALRPTDLLLMLPVYYAGGTTGFSPTSQDVADEYAQAGLPVRYAADRAAAMARLAAEATADDVILIMGARDPSLNAWARDVAKT
ncbi:MAG: hypothetical protein A3K19_15720 [Lentisphaerae bacterium RIFOXYB12_FULL_65_16]|nr:MAG: hypothetical protein A3K18_28425 [Lentisphaerae bacterium RIFOXYA12_64_32]OGV87377.1 MAG: hypothetical protein A3K19_15720 [Lentisphaerae bacterium RIFOXYB12_FULL_65_16]